MSAKRLIFKHILLNCCYLITNARQRCTMDGPVGAIDCLWFGAADNELTTCVTATFFRRTMRGQFGCERELVDAMYMHHCPFSCTAEFYGYGGTNNNYTADECLCDPNVEPDIASPLPEWCYSPDGDSCDWYTKCLFVVYPCLEERYRGDSFFEKRFCDFNSRNNHMFSPDVRQWMAAVSACLVVKLVPVIRPYFMNSSNCPVVDNLPFYTDLLCIRDPYSRNVHTLCDFNITDWAQVFWTVRGDFDGAKIPKLKIMLDAAERCNDSLLNEITSDTEMRLVKLTLQFLGDGTSNGTEVDTAAEYEDVAERVVDQLAFQLHWKREGVLWFTFCSNETEDNVTGVNILIGPRQLYDINAGDVPEADITYVLNQMIIAMENAKLVLDIGPRFNATRFYGCHDFGCRNTYFDVIPKFREANGVNEASVSIRSLYLDVQHSFFAAIWLLYQIK